MADEPMIWQAVMLIAARRIECPCGARALFIILEDERNTLTERDMAYTAWCQDCWQAAQEKTRE